jgi:hypothetical protein
MSGGEGAPPTIANTLQTQRDLQSRGFPPWGRVWGYPHGVKDVLKWVRAASNKRTILEVRNFRGLERFARRSTANLKDAGRLGLWTKADSVTLFDDFSYGVK